MVKYLLCVFILIASAGAVLADTVILKNGQIHHGEIFEETGYSVKMMIGGIPKVFYKDEVERVEHKQKEEAGDNQVQQIVSIDDVSAQKKELILRLLDVNGAAEGIQQTIRSVLGQMPDEKKAEFEKLLQSDNLVLRFVPIYATYYTEDEIRDLIRFYSSASGKRALEVAPKIMEESFEAAVKYFKESEK